MPRKRKQALNTISEEPQQGPCMATVDDSNVLAGIQELVEDGKEKVREKTEQLIEYALERAEQVRRQADPPLHNLSTHIKSMRVADFFQLSKDEAVGKVLTDLLGRLRILGGLADITDPDSDAAEGDVAGCSDQQRAEASRVMAGAMEAEDAASGPSTAAQELPQLQQGQGQAGAGCCGPSAMEVDRKTDAELMPPPPPPQTAARRGGNATAANGASTAAAAGAGAQHQAPFTVGRPARPPRVGDKLVYAGEQGVFSEQGSPIVLGGIMAEPPSTAGGPPGRSITDATPGLYGAYPTTAAAAPSAGSMSVAMTGATFRRGNAVKGRTKQATRAITVTTKDGRQFLVDDVIGLAAVPASHQAEVAAALEADKNDLLELVAAVKALRDRTEQEEARANAKAQQQQQQQQQAGGGAGAAQENRGVLGKMPKGEEGVGGKGKGAPAAGGGARRGKQAQEVGAGASTATRSMRRR